MGNGLELNIRNEPLPAFHALHGILIYIQSPQLQHIRKSPLRRLARHLPAELPDTFSTQIVPASGPFVFIHAVTAFDIQ
jgi:hypothetical protein